MRLSPKQRDLALLAESALRFSYPEERLAIILHLLAKELSLTSQEPAAFLPLVETLILDHQRDLAELRSALATK